MSIASRPFNSCTLRLVSPWLLCIFQNNLEQSTENWNKVCSIWMVNWLSGSNNHLKLDDIVWYSDSGWNFKHLPFRLASTIQMSKQLGQRWDLVVLWIQMSGVVYLGQHLGAVHSKSWLKYAFFTFFCTKNVNKEEKRGNWGKIKQKCVFWVCTQRLVEGWFIS